MAWPPSLPSFLHITYPIIQAPMLGVTTPEMVAAASNAGALGSLPVGGLSAERTKALIRQTKALTTKAFAVNLFANSIEAPDEGKMAAMQDFLASLCEKYGLKVPRPDLHFIPFYSYKEQIAILLEEQIPIVSFTFGVLDEPSIKALKAKGVVLIGTATCVKEAHILAKRGIDIITAQGIEAGGHRGTFLEEDPLPMIGSMSLVPAIAKQVEVPVLAAGGIYNGNTIKAAYELGAQGVQIGTAFIASDESMAILSYKKAVQEAVDTDTKLTRTFSGKWARGIRNTFMAEVLTSGLDIPAYPFQGHLTSLLRTYAQQHDNKEFTTLWAGQSVHAEAKPVAEIVKDLVTQFESLG